LYANVSANQSRQFFTFTRQNRSKPARLRASVMTANSNGVRKGDYMHFKIRFKRVTTASGLVLMMTFAGRAQSTAKPGGSGTAGTAAPQAIVAADAGSGTQPLFSQYTDLPVTLPNRSGGSTVVGAEAVAIFDANGDGFDDIALVSADPFYSIVINSQAPDGTRQFNLLPPAVVGQPLNGKVSAPDGLGLHDFNNDGLMDLYLCNPGKGTVRLINPRAPWDVSAANEDTSPSLRDSGYRTQLNNGDGTFTYKNLNADSDGTTRSAVFADFDGDGNIDMFTSNAPYFGVWWGGSTAPNELRAGRPDGTFGDNILPTAVTNAAADFWVDALGRANKDFKGVVVRDFDGDGKPDIILSAFSDVWDNVMTPPLGTMDPTGANVDANGDGIPDGGFQGDWEHGIVVLHNASTPGHISFEDVTATAIDNAFGSTDQMHVYVTVPADINNDGKLDLLVSGPRYFFAINSLQFQTDRVRVYRNDSTPGFIRFTDITKDTGMDAVNNDENLPKLSGGVYPVILPGEMLDGSDFVMTPLFSAAAALDINNDGFVDWVMIDRQLLSRNPITGAEFSAWVFLNDGQGHFKHVPAPVHGLLHGARELSYADLNHDGKLDLVLANTSGGGQLVDNDNYVYFNQTNNSNHWIEITAHLPGNSFGIGTKVTVYKAGTFEIMGYDEIRTDFAYRSKRPARVHCGLGNVDTVDVKLTFPDGTEKIMSGLSADNVYNLQP
jgi:hypothetical protein